MALFRWRSFVALILLELLPVSLFADESARRAILHSNGGVLVNGSAAPPSIAVFSGDVIQTQVGSVGQIDYEGSSVAIDQETILQLEDGGIVLNHGSVSLISFHQFHVRAGCITATPVIAAKTVYTVKDIDNGVTVRAQENDVDLDSHSGNLKRARQSESSSHDVVHQGEQKSRDEHCGAGDLTPTPANSGLLNSPWALGTAAALVVGGTACVLLCFNNKPASPSRP